MQANGLERAGRESRLGVVEPEVQLESARLERRQPEITHIRGLTKVITSPHGLMDSCLRITLPLNVARKAAGMASLVVLSRAA
jgi:hypothetical protein